MEKQLEKGNKKREPTEEEKKTKGEKKRKTRGKRIKKRKLILFFS